MIGQRTKPRKCSVSRQVTSPPPLKPSASIVVAGEAAHVLRLRAMTLEEVGSVIGGATAQSQLDNGELLVSESRESAFSLHFMIYVVSPTEWAGEGEVEQEVLEDKVKMDFCNGSCGAGKKFLEEFGQRISIAVYTDNPKGLKVVLKFSGQANKGGFEDIRLDRVGNQHIKAWNSEGQMIWFKARPSPT